MFLTWQRLTMCMHLLGRRPLCIIAIVLAFLVNHAKTCLSCHEAACLLPRADCLALISSTVLIDRSRSNLLMREVPGGLCEFEAEMEYPAHITGSVAKGGINSFKFSFFSLRVF